MRRRTRTRGFGLLEVMISAVLVLVAAMAAVAYVTRSAQHTDWSRDKVFARQKATSILAELAAYVEGGEGEVAADLDGFDDGLSVEPSLTIVPDPGDPGAFLDPEHPLSGNVIDAGEWRWYRRITVRPLPGVTSRDLRICTVKVFRMRAADVLPGELMAEVSQVVRTIADAYPTTQVYDVYLLALENTPGWWVYMDAIQPFVEATFSDLESRNPGLEFRTHWITKNGFGRDDEYAPYTNDQRDSKANTPWSYVYPGRMPVGEAAQNYYVATRMQARVNLDGEMAPLFTGDYEAQEVYTDTDGNGRRDPGEPYVDSNGSGSWDAGNMAPYALADMQNHCKRWPDEAKRFAERVAAGLEDEETPTWRLLLDRMINEPDRYHNAILINLHGELLPMPPARNYSDAAKVPVERPGWRAVTHPELLRPRRVAGNDTLSDPLRYRVYAYKTEFVGTESITTQAEPLQDANGNGVWDAGESYEDWNGNSAWDAGLPLTIAIPGGDFTRAPNAASNPSLQLWALAGGVDADGSGTADDYVDWSTARRYPEEFTDSNGDTIRQVAEVYLDVNGNGSKDAFEGHQELDGDASFTLATEPLTDLNGNNVLDRAIPAESYTDANGNGRWDAAEPYWDRDGNGTWTPPTAPVFPWQPWNPAWYGDVVAMDNYVRDYGEPFLDLDGDQMRDGAETFFDANSNGVRDGGFERGEMWFETRYDATEDRTVVTLHGTPLETPYLNNGTNDRKGLPVDYRLYDLDYIPCPTPASSTSTDRFGRDLFTSDGSVPKNTARWVLQLPLSEVRSAFETVAGANDGDAADRVIEIQTRFGSDLDTGVMWPTRHDPQNLSTTYNWFYDSVDDVPFSERYQFLGDPRHCPYADLDRQGATSVHGYNWYFDNLSNGTANVQDKWRAFEGSRLGDGWLGRGSGTDVARLMYWMRSALTKTEAIYTTLTGFSYYYLSVGGDIGYDSANGFGSSIPMDGKPFGLTGDVFESTITSLGTSTIRGSRKYVRSNDGTTSSIRSGGCWWSKPWLGELFQDSAYAAQWSQWGNLRANTGTTAEEYHLIRRADVPSGQEPRGTSLANLAAILAAEGCTSVFNIGSSSSTFHHQYQDGQSGTLVEDGQQIAENYNFPVPTTTRISRPFHIATSWSGGVGPEFGHTDAYPRFSAAFVRRFYNHQSGTTGSALVRLDEPGGARSGFVVVNGIDRTVESGSAFIARWSALSLIHSYFAGGAPGGTNLIRQLPRVQILTPTLITELEDPSVITVKWSTEWARWDGLKYTDNYPDGYADDDSLLVYVPMYSKDGGSSWLSMMDDQPVDPGRLPWIEGVGPDSSKVRADLTNGGDETFLWAVPDDDFPEGSYVIRVDSHRASESLHYSQHTEKIYVNR